MGGRLYTKYAVNLLVFVTLPGSVEDHEDKMGATDDAIRDALESIPGVEYGEVEWDIDEQYRETE